MKGNRKGNGGRIVTLIALLALISFFVGVALTVAKYVKTLDVGRFSVVGTSVAEYDYILYYHSYDASGDLIYKIEYYDEGDTVTFIDAPSGYATEKGRSFVGWLLSGIDEVNNTSNMLRYGNGEGMTGTATIEDLYDRQRGAKRTWNEEQGKYTGGSTTSPQYWTDENGEKVVHLFDVYTGPTLTMSAHPLDDFVGAESYNGGPFGLEPGGIVVGQNQYFVDFERYFDDYNFEIHQLYYLKSKTDQFKFYFHPSIEIDFTAITAYYNLNGTNTSAQVYITDSSSATDSGARVTKIVTTDEDIQLYCYNPVPSNATEKTETTCIASGTMISLADGSKIPVEELSMEHVVRVFNHETGTYEEGRILFIENDGVDAYNVINLDFSDGNRTKIIYEHALFDLDLEKYVYIREDNYSAFIGHRFATEREDGYGVVTLENAFVAQERVGCYSLVTEYHLNYFVDGLLSIPGGINGLFNIFAYGADLRYDKELMEADIAKYGLYTAEDFKEIVSVELFESIFPMQYLKVAIAKGVITAEKILYIVERYVVGHGLTEKEG